MDIFILSVIVFGLTSAADLNYMNETIRSYFADTRHHEVNTAYKARAKQFIYNEFKSFGLETVYHDFTHIGYNFSNVIGIKRGSAFGTSQDKIIGVVAHYDTVSSSKGVDDNGSGVAAMLEVAKQLKDFKFKNTIIYLAPDLEETGLTGSSRFVSEWLPIWASQNYEDLNTTTKNAQGCIVMDTMMEYNTSANSQTLPAGADALFSIFFPTVRSHLQADSFRGDFLFLIYRTAEDKTLADTFTSSWSAEARSQFELEYLALRDLTAFLLEEAAAANVLRSDHANFWSNSIPAIFITDSANFRGDMIECYHKQCDNLEVMLTDDNLMFLGKTADAIARTLKEKSECSDWNYGIDCAHNCTCNETYTETCNKTTGECHCMSGWQGSTCSDDINECDSEVCTDYSTCSNMPGSYNCECNIGYSKSLDGTACKMTSSNTHMEACFYVLALSMLVLEVLSETLF